MPDHIKYGSTTLWTAGASPNVVFVAERDINGRTHTFQELGDLSTDIFRGSKRKNKIYTIVMSLIVPAGSVYTLRELKAWWTDAHGGLGGEQVLECETSGGVHYLLAVANAPQWGEEHGPAWVEVVQEYEAATPLWYSAEQSASTYFNGTTPVSLACNNVGKTPAWVRLLIENEVDTPKVSYSTEWELEFNLAMSGGDELTANCLTPASVWYTPYGGAAAKAYGYLSFASLPRKAKLAVGNHNLTLEAGADNPELIANPDLETAGAGPPTFLNWTELLTHGTVNDEGVDVHGGSHAARLDSTADDVDHYIFQTFAVIPGETYSWSFWTHGDGVNDGLYGARDITNGAWIIDRQTTHTGVTGAVYEQVTETITIPAGCVSLRIYLNGTGVNGGSAYFDDVSLVNLGKCTVYWKNWFEALP